MHDKGVVELTFLQNIELEEELKLEFTLPTSLKLVGTWVQGINMYMGKTALIIDSSQNRGLQEVYQASLFLGACSEPNMKWQLVLQGQNSSGEKQSFFFNFSTER